jgi:O-antigen/teichoic acid export membrane protein
MASAAGSLRVRAARGTVVNAAFNVGLQLLGLLKGFIVAGFLTRRDYGVWGLLVISLGTLLWIAQIGVDDKYVQQDHPDQERAFQIAFTLQSVLAGMFMIVIAAGVPLFAIAYHEHAIVAPGLVLALAMPAAALQTPLWVYYRRMEYLKQRRLALFDPLTSMVVTLALAVAGLGYWALVIGTLAGSYAAATAAVLKSPYRLRFAYEKGTLREYASFSAPLLLSSMSGILIAQVPILIAQRHLGTAAVGAITLAGTITLYANRVDDIISNTLYPAICRVKDRTELLLESFTKSNRLALMWGAPCGVGIALFARDLVHYGIGARWGPAVPVLQIIGVAAGLNQFGFNWSAYYRAVNNTRPIAVTAFVMMVATLGFTTPLIFSDGLRGYAIGMAAATMIMIGMRCYYLLKLFPRFSVFAHAVRALGPTVPAAALVLGLRALAGNSRGPAEVAVEIALYGVLVVGLTLVSERSLLREVLGYLRGRTVPSAAA